MHDENGNFVDNYEEDYPSEFRQDCKDLLRMCLVAFNDLPDTPIKGSRGLTTYKIAAKIRELLKH